MKSAWEKLITSHTKWWALNWFLPLRRSWGSYRWLHRNNSSIPSSDQHSNSNVWHYKKRNGEQNGTLFCDYTDPCLSTIWMQYLFLAPFQTKKLENLRRHRKRQQGWSWVRKAQHFKEKTNSLRHCRLENWEWCGIYLKNKCAIDG